MVGDERCEGDDHCFFSGGRKTDRCARCDWTRGEIAQADADDKLFAGWQDRIEPRVVERLLGGHAQRCSLTPFVEELAGIAVRTTLEQVDEDCFCACDWHRSIPAEYGSDGKCSTCELPAEQHETVSVCPRRYDPPHAPSRANALLLRVVEAFSAREVVIRSDGSVDVSEPEELLADIAKHLALTTVPVRMTERAPHAELSEVEA